jgi:DUF2970 family protein
VSRKIEADAMSLPESGDRPPDHPASASAPPRPASLLQVMGAVCWSFLGVRKRAAMTADHAHIRPWQVILVAVVFVALFVVTLLTVVRLIVASAA